jgi:hypothetical protein
MPAVNNASLYGKNSAGVWKPWDTVWAKQNGVWKFGMVVWIKKDGAWQQVFVRLTPATSLSASYASGSKTVTLNWTAGLGADGYKIYAGTTLLKTVTGGSTVTTTVTLDYYTTYSVTVVAYAGTQDAAPSNAVSVYNTITAPSALSITGGSGTKAVTLSWTAGAGQETYYIYRGGTYIAQTTSTTYDTTLADYYTDYTFDVRGYYAGNTSGATSATKQASMATPSITNRTVGGWGYDNFNEYDAAPNMVITWGAIDGASSYDVYVSGGGYVTNVTAPTTSATIGVQSSMWTTTDGVQKNISYVVRALHSTGNATSFSGNATFGIGRPQLRSNGTSVKTMNSGTSNTNKVYNGNPVTIALPANCRYVSFRAQLTACFTTSQIDNDDKREVVFERPSVYGGDVAYTASQGNPNDRTFTLASGTSFGPSNNYGFSSGSFGISTSGTGWASVVSGAPSGHFYIGYSAPTLKLNNVNGTGLGALTLTLTYREVTQTQTVNTTP